MKKLISIFFLLLIVSQCGIQVGIYACWKLNQDYLALTVCEQRNVQGSCCKAKCQLRKQLKNTENETNSKNQSSSKKIKFAESESCFLIPTYFNLPFFMNNHDIKHYKDYFSFYLYEYKNISIEPPEPVV